MYILFTLFTENDSGTFFQNLYQKKESWYHIASRSGAFPTWSRPCTRLKRDPGYRLVRDVLDELLASNDILILTRTHTEPESGSKTIRQWKRITPEEAALLLHE